MRIGVLTSGGDAPGMNACLKSVVDMASNLGYEVYAFRRGYRGVISKDYLVLNRDKVRDIFNLGGSTIMTGRSAEFYEASGVAMAAQNLRELGIDMLVTIGGNGTYRGAYELSTHGIKIVAIPATIDNDVYSTDRSIGFDTSVNNAVDMISNIQATMRANERIAFIETMGRYGGDIALYSAIASESDIVLVPEDKKTEDEVLALIKNQLDRGNHAPIVILAEKQFDIRELSARAERELGQESRTVILGYMQRGGGPTLNDRLLAIRYGARAVQLIRDGVYNVALGVDDDMLFTTPIDKAIKFESHFRKDLYDLFKALHSV